MMVNTDIHSTVAGQHSDSVKFACFSPNGRYLAAADADRNVAVWSTQPTGNLLENLVWQQSLRHISDRFRAMDHVRSMVFANDDVLLIGSGETLRAVNVHNGLEIWRRESVPDYGFLVVTPVALARGKFGHIACAYADGLLELYPPGDSIPKWVQLDNDGPVRVQFSADGNYVFGTDRFTICVWEVATGDKVWRYPTTEKTFGMAVSRVSEHLIARSLFHCRTIQTPSGQVLAETPTKVGFPNVECHPFKEEYASVDALGFSVFRFNGEESLRIDTGYRPIGIAYSEQGSLVVTSLDGALRIYAF